MKSVKSKLSILAVAVLAMTACGSDSTGPGNLDPQSALQSLALGIQQFGSDGTTGMLIVDRPFGDLAPFLNQVSVNIDGSPQTMFALGLHESFPPGTCEETIFANIIPADPGVCTPPELGLLVMLWQSHSASEMPDRIAFLVGDVGTSNFDYNLDTPTLPAVAFYAEGEDNLWSSKSGTLTSTVTATPVTCGIPLPPYAKSGTCSIATFDEEGSVVLEPFTLDGTGNKTKTLTIPRQTLHGLWMAISEVQPIGLTASRLMPRGLMERMGR